ncbi:MAG: exodeoxyribonuclease VII small subunit [Anaerolineae bacterium]|jgi:exodeoxyribonuclease VII small subunit|nr:exodeoxyribonuclease VII small subunit [Anaerolineae bacterium]
MTDFETLPFEQALRELEEIVQKLEAGTLPLEETVSLYQQGRTLAEHCQRFLDAAELRVQQLTSNGEGGYTAASLDKEG